MIILIVLTAFSMRCPIGCVGPLMSELRSDLFLTATEGGMLTTLPLMLFAFSAPFSVAISGRIGMKRLISISFLLILLGTVTRALGSVFPLFMGTVLIGLGTGFLNVVIPAFFKEYYPLKSGKLMGMYSSSLTFASATTAAFIEPLSRLLGSWSAAFLAVFVFPLGALLFSFTLNEKKSGVEEKDENILLGSIWTGRNIMIALYSGVQSLIFYTILTWYPTIIRSKGIMENNSGLLITIMQIASFFPAYLIPVVSNRKNIIKLSVIIPLVFIPGMLLSYLSGNMIAVIAGTFIFGLSVGGTFSIGITLCSVYGRNGHDTARMMSFGQCIGYILASFGPTGFGYLYDRTLSWTGTIILLIILSLLMSITALQIRKDR